MLQTNDSHFTPARLRLPKGLDPLSTRARIQFIFEAGGDSGLLYLWNTSKADPNRNQTQLSVLDGGNRLFPFEEYSLQQLGYDPVTGGATVFLEAIQVHAGHYSKYEVDNGGKPDDRIQAKIANIASDVSDEVKYMIVQENSFYPNLQNRPELRNAMASEGVYAVADLPQFALKLLGADDFRALQIPQHIIDLVGEPGSIPGFKNAVYLDHVSGVYVLSFAGTDDIDDVLVDLWQGLGYFTDQYHAAMQIGDAFSRAIRNAGLELVVTGHSLGGGLASAAAVVGDIPSVTYNAAGLLEETLLARDQQGNVMPGVELYAGSLQRYSNATNFIKAYYLDWDILSFAQDHSPMQDAIGSRIEMDGPLDLEMAQYTVSTLVGLLSGAGWLSIAASLGRAGYTMGLAHMTVYYHYGLMVDETTGWNIHGYDL